MSKLNAGQKSSYHVTPSKGEYAYPNPDYDCERDEKKQKQAENGEFGTKEQTKAAIARVHEKTPCLDITLRTNSTVR